MTDAARSRVFSRFARLITLESKKAGGSVTAPGLKAVIDRAKAANMPKDNIERAVAKGASKDAGDLEEVVYECYGPGGAAIVIDALTDSRNRTTQELKLIMTKNGIELAAPRERVVGVYEVARRHLYAERAVLERNWRGRGRKTGEPAHPF